MSAMPKMTECPTDCSAPAVLSAGTERFTLDVNDCLRTFVGEPDTPLLWVLREGLCLTGTKYGCGIARCGACTVLLDGIAVRSCITAISHVKRRKVRTIEGLEHGTGNLHSVQKAWLEANVPQCGYCQSGQIMATVALFEHTHDKPTPEQVDQALAGNLCRCGTYPRIRQAIARLAGWPFQDEPAPPKCS